MVQRIELCFASNHHSIASGYLNQLGAPVFTCLKKPVHSLSIAACGVWVSFCGRSALAPSSWNLWGCRTKADSCISIRSSIHLGLFLIPGANLTREAGHLSGQKIPRPSFRRMHAVVCDLDRSPVNPFKAYLNGFTSETWGRQVGPFLTNRVISPCDRENLVYRISWCIW